MAGFLNKFKDKFGSEEEEGIDVDEFLDTLGVENEDLLVEEADMWVKSYILESGEDVSAIGDDLDRGNIIILNVEPLYKRNQVKLKQVVSRIKEHSQSIDGDIARLSEYKILLTPRSVKVAKTKK